MLKAYLHKNDFLLYFSVSERIKLHHHIPLRDMVSRNLYSGYQNFGSLSLNLCVLENGALQVAGFINLIEENGRHIEGNNNFEQQNKTWSGMDMVAVLQMAGAGPEVFSELKASVTLVCTG